MFPNSLLLLAVLTIGALPLFMFNIANAQSDIPPPEGNNTAGPAPANNMKFNDIRQDLDKLLKCVVSKSNVEQLVHRALGLSLGNMFNEKCAWQSQQPQQQNLLLNNGDTGAEGSMLELVKKLPSFADGFAKAVYTCFNEDKDNSDCCQLKGIPEECLTICGQSETQPSGASCEAYLPLALECHGERSENLVLRNLAKYQKFRVKRSEGDCRRIGTVCPSVAAGCAVTSLVPGIGTIAGAFCGLGTGAGCLFASVLSDCL